jgi:hypothetical protein
MDEKTKEMIREAGGGKSYYYCRQVGNRRIEIFFVGDNEPTSFELEAPEEEERKALSKMRMAELREIAADLGIQTRKMKKADLLASIEAFEI